MAGRTRIAPLVQVLVLGIVTLLAGTASQLLRDNPIAWTEDWSNRVLAAAMEAGLPILTAEEAREVVDSMSHIVLDARPLSDFDAGHLPTALPLPVDDLETHQFNVLPMLTPDQPVMVYCSGLECDESIALGTFLIQQGYTNVALFAGGITEWKDKGYPVE